MIDSFRKKFIKYVLVSFLFFIALAVWAIASPVGSAPDEDFHQTMIYCASGKATACLENGVRYGHCFTMRPTVAGACKNYSDLELPIATTINSNTALPVYYETMQLFVSNTLGETTLNIRLTNALLAVLLGALSVLLTFREFRVAAFLSLVICSVPAGFFFMSSISPSSWAIISVACLVGPLYSLVSQIGAKEFSCPRGRLAIQVIRTLFVCLLVAIGFGSRYETFIWIPVVVVFVTLANIGQLETLRSSRKILITVVFVIGFTLAAMVFVFVERSPIGFQALYELIATNPFSWWVLEKSFNTLFGMMALTGIPGAELGTHDAPITPIASFFISVAVGGAIFASISKATFRHAVLFVLLLVTVLFITLMLWSVQDWDYYQPRYFLPVFYFILLFALLSQSAEHFIQESRYWFLILISVTIVHALALLSTLLRFTYGLKFQESRFPLGKEAIDVDPSRLFAAPIPDWWLTDISLLTPFSIWIIGSVSFTVAVLLAWTAMTQGVILRESNEPGSVSMK